MTEQSRPRWRSGGWFDGVDETAVLHRVALPRADGRSPVIGIADTSSDLNPCHARHGEVIDEIERGIIDAGGIPARFPMMSLGEDLMKPSAMLYRNLAAMEIEEHARAYPLDALVLTANCDKTVAAALLGAASADLPALVAFGGARSSARFQGRPIGTGTDLWRALEERRAGQLNDAQWAEFEKCLSCAGVGACNTMGTASTMTVLTEALGMALPGWAGIAATGPEVLEHGYATGLHIVTRARNGIVPSRVITQGSLDNALIVLAAIGGSTNAIIHLAALAGRLGLDASLKHADRLWRTAPLIADIEPCGAHLIRDFHQSGGLASVLAALADIVDLEIASGDDRSWATHCATAPRPVAGGIIRTMKDPVAPAPTLVSLFGSLAPTGAVLKVAGASSELLTHTGPALVLDDYATMRARLDDPNLDVDPDVVVVLRGVGPVGAPGMPEWGMAPIPAKLLANGVRDVVRISDGRMSGTGFGTVALHVSPEAAVGGPLAMVQDGDLVELNVSERRLDLRITPSELAARQKAWTPTPSPHLRGWPALYRCHVLQAPQGCDLDILTSPTPAHRVRIEPVIGRS